MDRVSRIYQHTRNAAIPLPGRGARPWIGDWSDPFDTGGNLLDPFNLGGKLVDLISPEATPKEPTARDVIQKGNAVDLGDAAKRAIPPAPQGYQAPPGAVVRAAATDLRTLGYPTPITDNALDPNFRGYVILFQKDHQPLAGRIDGLLGPVTLGAIATVLGKPKPKPAPAGPAPAAAEKKADPMPPPQERGIFDWIKENATAVVIAAALAGATVYGVRKYKKRRK